METGFPTKSYSNEDCPACPIVFATPALAADASALTFVTDIYSGYNGKDSPGRALDSDPVIRRYFEPSLAN